MLGLYGVALIGLPLVAAVSGASWIDRAPIPRPRLFHIAGIGGDGRIYVAAGKVQKPGSSVVYPGVGPLALDVYSPDSNRWEQGPDAPNYRAIRREYQVLRDPDFKDRIIREGLQTYDYEFRHDSEYPPGCGAPDGRVYWFSRIGPIYFDPESGRWDQGDPIIFDQDKNIYIPPVANWFRLMGATAASPDGKLYLVAGTGYPTVVGRGANEDYRVLDSLEVYDPATRAWAERTPMRQARQMPAAAFGRDGKLYVFGGFGALGIRRQEEGESDEAYKARSRKEKNLARNALRSVEAYDPATDTWEDRAPMPAGRQSMGAALGADGRIYVVGGADQYSNPAPRAEVFIYDPKTDAWSEGPPLNHPRYHHAVVATPDGRIWAIGGTNGTNRRGALPRGEPEGLVRPIEMLETRPASAPTSSPDHPR